MTLEEEITVLTEKYYKYVSLDHHKDRDCHFWIEKKWSYGNPPTYSAHHVGYVGSDLNTKEFDEEEDAMMWLADNLRNKIKQAIKYLEGTDYWDKNDKVGFPKYELMGLNKEQADDMLELLKKELV